ncbi:MAG TPA: OB-fold nucleic acid binding domain-containing protein [Methylomirabilota bacterium]|nr:OB-fold nucleic acid binding domain-containing protein [Methylomirabilota bacterium]
MLHDSLLEVKAHSKLISRTVNCGDLKIEIRSGGASSSMYMFSAKGRILGQADLQSESISKLTRLPAEFSSFLEAKDEHSTDSNRVGTTSEISTLRYGWSGVTFKARVMQKSSVRAVTSRDGTALLVCEVTLSDGTGEIPLTVWNSQISTVAKGDLIHIENARVRSFRGKIQLSLGRKTGILTVLEHAPIPN